MHTRVQASAEQSNKQHQKATSPAQLVAEANTSIKDSRPETAQCKSLQNLMAQSPAQQKNQTLQAKMASGQIAQKAEDEDTVQGKFETFQSLYRAAVAPVQLREIEETRDFNTLNMQNTGDKFSVVSEYGKTNATLYGDRTEPEEVGDRGDAMVDISDAAAEKSSDIKDIVKKEGGYTKDADAKVGTKQTTIDPFSVGYVRNYVKSDSTLMSMCLIFQHTHDLDGYMSGIEESVAGSDTSGREVVAGMRYGRQQAHMRSEGTRGIGSYSSKHERTGDSVLMDLSEGSKEAKADATAKLVAEGARFNWVRDNIDTITDETRFTFEYAKGKSAYITFNNLWCVWKDWFKGDYGITEQRMTEVLSAKARAGHGGKMIVIIG